MTKKNVFILPIGAAADRDKLGSMLQAIDCVTLVVEIADAQVVVVLIDPAAAALNAADDLIGAATGRHRLIGVYGAAGHVEVPSALEELADALVPMDPDALTDAICHDARLWLDETGDDWTPPETQRECSTKGC